MITLSLTIAQLRRAVVLSEIVAIFNSMFNYGKEVVRCLIVKSRSRLVV